MAEKKETKSPDFSYVDQKVKNKQNKGIDPIKLEAKRAGEIRFLFSGFFFIFSADIFIPTFSAIFCDPC